MQREKMSYTFQSVGHLENKKRKDVLHFPKCWASEELRIIVRDTMKFYENTYYHIYNRTNNEEVLFRSEENYLYFLKKYRFYLEEYIETVGYCLMPTHFHFLVRVRSISEDARVKMSNTFPSVGHLEKQDVGNLISRAMQTLQSSYTKAINKRYNRHGSLFQAHFNAKSVPSDRYLITLLTYIHQNPVRNGLVKRAEEWLFSSYQDYIDLRNGTLPSKDMILGMIKKDELREMTKRIILIEPS